MGAEILKDDVLPLPVDRTMFFRDFPALSFEAYVSPARSRPFPEGEGVFRDEVGHMTVKYMGGGQSILGWAGIQKLGGKGI